MYFARMKVGGKFIRRSLKTDRITVAKQRLADMEKEERSKVGKRRNVALGIASFGDVLAVWQDRVRSNHKTRPRTKEYWQACAERLLRSWPGLDAMDVRKITEDDCRSWASRFAAQYSPQAVNNTLSALRQVLEIARDSGAIYANPADKVDRVKIPKTELDLPSVERFKELVQAIESSGVNHCRRAARLVEFLAYGGFRISEAASVLWRDVDMERGTIRVRPGKNGEGRIVPIIPAMRGLLERIRPAEPDMDTRVMPTREARRHVANACAKLGIPHLRHHDFRHLFATSCIEAGVDIPTVSRWLGHKDGGALAMRVYGHPRDKHHQDMAAKVDFGGAA